MISKLKAVGKFVFQFMVALSKYSRSEKLWNVYEMYLLTRGAFEKSYVPIQNLIFDMLNVILDLIGIS